GVQHPSAPAASAGAKASPQERAALTRQLVTKWGGYVQRVYGVPVTTWAKRMAPTLARVDGDNFRDALKRDTFEGAMAALGGAGDQLSDAQMIDRFATKSAAAGTVGTKTLGALSNDLVYTPVAPCRILDTRSTAAGAIAANGTRNFIAINASNFTSQGGSSTNCGTLGLNATAVAINLTAVTPAGAGYATAFPYGTSQPVAASVNYAAGDIVNNALIVQIPNPLSSFDFTLYTFAQSHYVADIVGYFAPPLATALQCQTTGTTVVNVAAGGQTNVTAPACATGYTQTATNCEASSWTMPFVFIKDGVCSAQNNGTSAADVRASRTCCRVPGR
ncbi:MAG: hypothetical protein ACTHOH_09725, partial [Lysobacteraceae bacterium]